MEISAVFEMVDQIEIIGDRKVVGEFMSVFHFRILG